jgi:hypothetical protein
MKSIIFFLFILFSPFVKSQNQVVVSLVSEHEGQVVRIYSDTLYNTRVVYNLTGYESVGTAVLNVIALYDDGSESRKEFDLLEYKKEDGITEIVDKAKDEKLKYIFMHEENILITQDKKGNIMWEGDIIF